MSEKRRTYSVGDVVWWASYRMEKVKTECPICFGKKEVTLILGNGEEVVLPCDYCGKGFLSPKGTVETYEYLATPQQMTIDSVRSNTTFKGEEIEYLSNNRFLDIDDVFDSKEDAIVRCEIKAEKAQREREENIEYLKKDAKKSFSWNAGYWLRQIKSAEEDIERYKKKAVLCNKRATK